MKRIITTLVAGSVLLSFTACSKSTQQNDKINLTESSVFTEVSTEVTTSETEKTSSKVSSSLTNPANSGLRLYPVYQSIKLLTLGAQVYTFDPGYFDDQRQSYLQ